MVMIKRIFLIGLMFSVIIGVQAQSGDKSAGDTDGSLYGRPPAFEGLKRVEITPREMGRFDFPDRHTVQFLLLDDGERSVAIYESGNTGSTSLSRAREMDNASPSTIWYALSTGRQRIPPLLVELYGQPVTHGPPGWLGERWLSGGSNPTGGGLCDDSWFGTVAGTPAAYPSAQDHFVRYNRYAAQSGGGDITYYQYAGWVKRWNGGICVQAENQLTPQAAPGSGWWLTYLRPNDSSLYYITPVFAVWAGGWGHWGWVKPDGSSPRFWHQELLPNQDMEVYFDMGMDWTYN
jgi:hypothetical protein